MASVPNARLDRTTSLRRFPPEPAAPSVKPVGLRHSEARVVECGRVDEYRHRSPTVLVGFLLQGTTGVEWRRSGRLTRFLSEPGSLTIVPPGNDHVFQTDRWSRSLSWSVDPRWLQSVADQEWRPRGLTVEIQESFNNRDAEFWTLGQRLAAHISAPHPGSRLYAESLSIQLALHLLWNYSSLPGATDARAERLSDPRLRRVIDYIRSSLGNEISLELLAELAGLSPSYFLSAFRQATGQTPHRYLIEQRVAKACELLQNPHRSIVEVALAVGFSSQSHLTTVFRRFMGTTPAAYREDVLSPKRREVQ
jgi:AraC family transcriptional regulator